MIWNALSPELWRRLTDYTKRALAHAVGITMEEFRRVVRLSFLKAAEGQGRGAIHFHAIFRLDAASPDDDPDQVAPSPAEFSAEVLADAVRWAAGAVSAPYPGLSEQRPGGYARFGEQIDIRNDSADGLGELNAKAVALYVGKYATKSTGGLKALDYRLGEAEVSDLRARGHVVALVQTAWSLGRCPGLEELGLQRWAHQFGFGGHWHTKSFGGGGSWEGRQRLGHATIAITLDTYSHVLPGLDEQAAAIVARLILGPEQPPAGPSVPKS